ncbi:PEP-CTERM sorting domain-containing protein [Thiobacillus sp. 65-1402]|uniref:PEP-CTERM sorting domain-containing protein n=1 Tax=Thiobacillus sp. 65-1402 TaxID=1895861 RepID=UPI000968E0F5|nr:PEP-CTERM sorting domain-containing protein [Thiobacillus sp. 65-1402]OJW92522.1 MAG: hypothetical protein BGO62_03585 [Thiobacillus sp. 65-1402]
MRTCKKTAQAVMGFTVALLAGNALAAIPAPLVGTYLTYTFITDPGLFGTASLVGDDLVFAPTAAFKATSANGAPGFKSQNVIVQVSINDAYLSTLALSSFSLSEGGSYSLSGTSATAGATGYLSALDIEGTTANSLSGSITASGLGVPGTHAWTGAAGIALPGTGWGGADGVVSSVKLTLSNQLFATTGPNSAAEIWKDAVNLHVATSPIPEAETYAMMLAGLGLVGFMARRRARLPA